jgi:hypothetical protein
MKSDKAAASLTEFCRTGDIFSPAFSMRDCTRVSKGAFLGESSNSMESLRTAVSVISILNRGIATGAIYLKSGSAAAAAGAAAAAVVVAAAAAAAAAEAAASAGQDGNGNLQQVLNFSRYPCLFICIYTEVRFRNRKYFCVFKLHSAQSTRGSDSSESSSTRVPSSGLQSNRYPLSDKTRYKWWTKLDTFF